MAENILSEGIKLYAFRKYAEALRFFESIIPDESGINNLDIMYYIGLCYARLEKAEEAIQCLEQVVTASANMQRVKQCRLLLAVLYTQTGRLSLADYELRILLEGGYQSVNVLTALGYSAWAQERDSEAVDWYTKALEIDPDNPTALNGYGFVLASAGKDLTRALSLCRRALEIIPESPVYLDSIAWVYYKLGLLKEAKSYIKKAKNRSPKNDDILNHYKVIYEQMADNAVRGYNGGAQ